MIRTRMHDVVAKPRIESLCTATDRFSFSNPLHLSSRIHSSRPLYTMPPVSASKAKRQADKAAKASAKQSGKDTPKGGDSVNGSTAVGSSSGKTAVGDDAGLGDMKKLSLATDRCVDFGSFPLDACSHSPIGVQVSRWCPRIRPEES
jgi:hypothetical protein